MSTAVCLADRIEISYREISIRDIVQAPAKTPYLLI